MAKKRQPGIIITEAQRKFWEVSSDEEAGQILKILLAYQFEGVIPEDVTDIQRVALSFIIPQLEQQRADYESKCQKAKEAASKRYDKSDD